MNTNQVFNVRGNYPQTRYSLVLPAGKVNYFPNDIYAARNNYMAECENSNYSISDMPVIQTINTELIDTELFDAEKCVSCNGFSIISGDFNLSAIRGKSQALGAFLNESDFDENGCPLGYSYVDQTGDGRACKF